MSLLCSYTINKHFRNVTYEHYSYTRETPTLPPNNVQAASCLDVTAFPGSNMRSPSIVRTRYYSYTYEVLSLENVSKPKPDCSHSLKYFKSAHTKFWKYSECNIDDGTWRIILVLVIVYHLLWPNMYSFCHGIVMIPCRGWVCSKITWLQIMHVNVLSLYTCDLWYCCCCPFDEVGPSSVYFSIYTKCVYSLYNLFVLGSRQRVWMVQMINVYRWKYFCKIIYIISK
jgi:hypothetical protein